MVRRIAMLALSLSLTLGLMGAHHLLAQDEKKTEAKKDDKPKAEAKKADEAKKPADAKPSASPPAPAK